MSGAVMMAEWVDSKVVIFSLILLQLNENFVLASSYAII